MPTSPVDPDYESAWAKTSRHIEIFCGWEDSDRIKSQIWFKSEPLTSDFVHRVAQIQLCTDSNAQGGVDNPTQGNWSWFELVLFPNTSATKPKLTREGKEMVWKSHYNQLGNPKNNRNYGLTFDRRSDLLASLEVGDVVAVRACARFRAWKNEARKGYITARVLKEDLYTPNHWSLSSQVIPDHSEKIKHGVFTFSASTSCLVMATGPTLSSKIWFTTPKLDTEFINGLESLQLFTRARYQREQPNTEKKKGSDSRSWFDIVVLENPTATHPKVVNSASMVWLSHTNESDDYGVDAKQGQLFEEGIRTTSGDDFTTNDRDEQVWKLRAAKIQQIRGALQPGNVIGVRVCAQFQGWENHAENGYLVARVSRTESRRDVITAPDISEAVMGAKMIQESAIRFYKEVSKSQDQKFNSIVVDVITNEVRADQLMNGPASTKPLQLLCLDGGGVRGVSSLRILKAIMDKLPYIDGRQPHPYEVFDMMAGTSTGGLIAIMLGKFKMSIKECEEVYQTISADIFSRKKGGPMWDWFLSIFASLSTAKTTDGSQPLRDAIKDLVKIFDMMTGMSTKGTISTMLKGTETLIGGCESIYKSIYHKLLAHTTIGEALDFFFNTFASLSTGKSIYSSEPLIAAIKRLVKGHDPLGNVNAKLQEEDHMPETNRCKVFVVACRAKAGSNEQPSVHLRSYNVPQKVPKAPEDYPKISIWEAARATSAAPTYFDSLKFEDDELIDGGMGFNNPIHQLLGEKELIYGYQRPVSCIVSLGTGMAPDYKFSVGPISTSAAAISMLTSSERAHNEVKNSFRGNAGQYWRFNLGGTLRNKDGVANFIKRSRALDLVSTKGEGAQEIWDRLMVSMDDHTTIPLLQDLTEEWLALEEVKGAIEDCAKRLKVTKRD